MSSEQSERRLGSAVAGLYRLEQVLASGSVGTVYGGVDLRTGQEVAVKVLEEALAHRPGLSDRFLGAARQAERASHPNAVRLLDLLYGTDGVPALVFERLEGETLADRLTARGALGAAETLGVLLPVMDALSYAHRAGLVHGAIKPGHIFLGRDPDGVLVPKLLDFGTGVAFDGVGPQVSKEGYVAPEQARCEGPLVATSDVWAMGAVLFTCLTGRAPPVAGAPLALATIASDVPPALAAAIERALADDRWARPADMAALSASLIDAALVDGVPLPPPAPDGRMAPPGASMPTTDEGATLEIPALVIPEEEPEPAAPPRSPERTGGGATPGPATIDVPFEASDPAASGSDHAHSLRQEVLGEEEVAARPTIPDATHQWTPPSVSVPPKPTKRRDAIPVAIAVMGLAATVVIALWPTGSSPSHVETPLMGAEGEPEEPATAAAASPTPSAPRPAEQPLSPTAEDASDSSSAEPPLEVDGEPAEAAGGAPRDEEARGSPRGDSEQGSGPQGSGPQGSDSRGSGPQANGREEAKGEDDAARSRRARSRRNERAESTRRSRETAEPARPRHHRPGSERRPTGGRASQRPGSTGHRSRPSGDSGGSRTKPESSAEELAPPTGQSAPARGTNGALILR
jgi:serine/threonine protein kinase